MSHLDFVRKIRAAPTENRFYLSLYDAASGVFVPTGAEYRVCVVGRNPDCCVRLSDARCSRYHCALYFTEDALNVRDLDSRLGTEVGAWRGGALAARQRLPPFAQQSVAEGACVRVGDAVLRVDRVALARAAAEPLRLVPAACRFCGGRVSTYLRELQRLGDHAQALDTQAQRTAAALAAEEQRLADVLARVGQIARSEAGRAVRFRPAASVIGPQAEGEGPQKALKSARERKNTPFARAAYDDDDE